MKISRIFLLLTLMSSASHGMQQPAVNLRKLCRDGKLEAVKRWCCPQRIELKRDQLQAKLRQRTAKVEETDKELDLIKQTLVRGVRETKELESQYMDAVGEKVTAIARAKQAVEEKCTSSEYNECRTLCVSTLVFHC